MKKTNQCFRWRVAQWLLVSGLIAGVAGCSTVPDTITHETPEKPNVAKIAPSANGAIFQSGSYRPMFEDRRAMYVGDTITIVINEKTSAAKQGAGSASHTGSASYSAGQIFNVSGKYLDKLGVSTEAANKFEDKGATSSSNNFTGTISAIVADVMPNGNLLVKGEKQIALDKGTEFIRISGIVDPKNIVAGNQISSALVADARVEYRSNTRIDMADIMSMLSRFFLTISPI